MRRWGVLVSMVLTVGCGADPTLTLLEGEKFVGPALILSVREPASEADVAALIEERRGARDIVRVFVYGEGKQPGKDAPASRWEWTRLEGLRAL